MDSASTASRIPPEYDIRLAAESDIRAVGTILDSAFQEDPILQWVVGRPNGPSGLFRSEIEALYKFHRHVYVNAENTGAALWLPPGVSSQPPFHWRLLVTLFNLFRTGGFGAMRRVGIIENVMKQNKPETPHFYLHAIGASQGNQGRGIGSALLKAGLRACDEMGAPAYLESSNERNNPLYERFGFEISKEFTLPEQGPKVWFMWREARR